MAKKRYPKNTAHVRGVSDVANLAPEAMSGSFQSAEWSRDRGYVYIPTLDTKQEVDALSHMELLKRGRFIRNSGGGLIQRGIKGVARMVCGTGLMPYPTPPKIDGRVEKLKEWSLKVRQRYALKCGNANTFHLGRRYNTGSAQRATIANKITDGDLAWVLARDEVTNRLRVAIYDAPQIGSGTGLAKDGWHHGVLCGRHNEALMYRLLGKGADGKPTQTDVPAEHVLFVADFERLNQVRGLTRFYPVLNKVMDRGEIMAAITKKIKIGSNIAYVIEEAARAEEKATGGAGANMPRPTKMIQTADGKTISMEQFLGGGEAWGLRPGQTFKMVQAMSPHPNEVGHLNELVRDVAHTLGYFPEVLWNIIELGGANTRFVQADTQSQIEVEQEDLVDQALGPHYVAWLRDEIEHGDIEEVEGWEQHAWIAPARLTVDFGRDGKLHLDQYKRGMITMKSLYGFRGEEWRLEIDQYLDERQYITQGVLDRSIRERDGTERSMTPQEAFPEIGQQQQALPAEADDAPEEEEVKDNKPAKQAA